MQAKPDVRKPADALRGHPDSLPPYSGGETYILSTGRIDSADADCDQEMELEMGGYFAYVTRSAPYKQAKGEVKEVFQQVFTRETGLRAAKLGAAERRALYPRILELNRVKEGSLVFRRGASPQPTASAERRPASRKKRSGP